MFFFCDVVQSVWFGCFNLSQQLHKRLLFNPDDLTNVSSSSVSRPLKGKKKVSWESLVDVLGFVRSACVWARVGPARTSITELEPNKPATL